MNIYLCSWNFNDGEKELARNIALASVSKEATLPPEISFVEGEVNMLFQPLDQDVVITFGPRPASILKNKTTQIYALPLLSKLVDVPENEKSRSSAWDIIKTISTKKEAKKLETTLSLNDKDIVALNEQVLKAISTKTVQDKWIVTTEAGTQIAILSDPTQKLELQNIKFILSFEEVLAAKAAMDVLNLKKLIIMKGNEENVKN